MRTVYFARAQATVLGLLLLTPCLAWAAEPADAAPRDKKAGQDNAQNMITLHADKPVVANFLGFGTEWDPNFWVQGTFKTGADGKSEAGVTEEDWALVTRRIRWMRLPLVRMMILSRWCTAGDGKFNWESKNMQSLYRHLDVCQKEGIQVILTDWGCVPEWVRVAGYSGVGDPKYAAGIGTYLDYLVNERKYTCLRYFILVNEPDNEAGGYDNWKQGVLNVAQVLRERKLSDRICFLGSDMTTAEDWHRKAVDQLQGVLGGYDFHRYAPEAEVRSGDLGRHIAAMWQYALAKDPQARNKPLMVAEAGIFSPGFTASNNPLHLKYEYGLYMADYAAQAADAGSQAVLAWMLDDSSHAGFTWGMWQNKGGGFALKPWFYTWSLLTRYFPRGSSLVAAEHACAGLRVLAGRIPKAEGAAWTVCLVNRDSAERKLRLSAPGAGKAAFQRYVYSRAETKTDADGFPAPVATEELDLNEGSAISCPGDGVVVLTSLKVE